MSYTKWFNPDYPADPVESRGSALGDRADSIEYVYDDRVILAVNLALASHRPLLVSGPSGCGKSSLASDMKRVLGWEYERQTIYSRMQAHDLLYDVDYVKRLQDAHADRLNPDFGTYIRPGVLWRAFDPTAAALKKGSSSEGPSSTASSDGPPEKGQGAVVLLDEIDKADPDVPNNLLLPLGSYEFFVDEIQASVYAQRRCLLVLTSNNERRLPDAFVRRCVDLQLAAPGPEMLAKIGRKHLEREVESYRKKHPEIWADLFDKVAVLVDSSAHQAEQNVSTAEYLDTLRAIISLDVPEQQWKDLPEYLVRKSNRSEAM
jgi:MoxR-like ATPase